MQAPLERSLGHVEIVEKRVRLVSDEVFLLRSYGGNEML